MDNKLTRIGRYIEDIVDYPNRREFRLGTNLFFSGGQISEKEETDKIVETLGSIVGNIRRDSSKERYFIVIPYEARMSSNYFFFEYIFSWLREGKYFEKEDMRIIQNLNVITALPDGKESKVTYSKITDYLSDLLIQKVAILGIPVENNLKINIKRGTINGKEDWYTFPDIMDMKRRLEERLESERSELTAAMSICMKTSKEDRSGEDDFVWISEILINNERGLTEAYGYSPQFRFPRIRP